MALKVDYYTLLSRAVGGLDRDSYAARGAIYDREHKALMRRLFTADPPLSDEEIDREQQNFRAAVRRIEFGEEDDPVTLVPQRDAAEPTAPPAVAAATGRRQERDWSADLASWSQRIPSREAVHWSQRKPADEPKVEPTHWSQRSTSPEPAWSEPSLEPQFDPQPDLSAPALQDGEHVHVDLRPKRKSVFGRVLRRALLAVVVLGLSFVAYDLLSGNVELPLLTKLAGDGVTSGMSIAPLPQQAVIFDSNPPNPDGPKATGTAVWRTRSEPASGQGEQGTVLQFDLKIPDRHIIMAMSMRREAPGSAMSHTVELRFLREDQEPDGDIDNIAPIVMTTAEQKEPSVLVGQVVKVTPGLFLFGLSGQAKDREQNERFLKELTWFDIPLVYRNGFTGVLAVEKGAPGDRAVRDAFAQWSK